MPQHVTSRNRSITANEAWADAGWQMLLDTGLATGTYVVDVNPFRRPGSADAVAVVMTRCDLQAPAAQNHQPAQAGPRHAAEACLLAPAGAARAHRHDLCAGAQPTLSEGQVLSKETSRRCLSSPTTSPPRGLAKDKPPVKQELVPSTPVHRRGA